MIRLACLVLLVVLAGVADCLAGDEAVVVDPAQSVRELVASVVSAKTASGRFVAVGVDRLAVYDFARWAEDLSLRFENITGAQLPSSGIPLIRFYFAESAESEPGVSLQSKTERGLLTHSMQIVNYEPELVERVLDAISHCLAATAIYSERKKRGRDMSEVVIPKWLTDGIGQNMYPETRKRNSERLLSDWKKGEMLSLNGLLADREMAKSEETTRMGRGLLVGWMLSFGKDVDIVGNTFGLLIEQGKVLPAEMMQLMGTAGIENADRGWDAWMLKQTRMVYLPGKTSLSDLAWLKHQLLILPEDFGIQLSDEVQKQLAPEDLIRLKGHERLRAVVKSRFIELHLKGAGKGDAFRGVVDAYCKFLDGVAAEKADWRLRRYLEAANEQLRDFEVETLTLRIMDGKNDKKEAVKE